MVTAAPRGERVAEQRAGLLPDTIPRLMPSLDDGTGELQLRDMLGVTRAGYDERLRVKRPSLGAWHRLQTAFLTLQSFSAG